MVQPQLETIRNTGKVISMIKESENNAFAKAFETQSTIQGALALAQNVANNPMLQLAKSAGIAQFRDFGFRKEVIIMCETFTIKELQIVEYSISTLINEGMKHYNVSFLIQALGELIECNSLTYLDYQPLLERPMLKSKELELVDWEKLYSAVQDSFKNTTFPFIINYLISNPRCLLNTICHLPLNTMVNSSISLPSNLYDVTFIGLNKKYDFLQIPENEPIQILSLQISEINN